MTNRQYRDCFLRSKVNECLHNAAGLLSTNEGRACAIEHLNRALAFARQLPDKPKNRAIRAHVVSALEILQ